MVQSKHDAKVKEVASRLKRQGWKVKADIKGYKRPDPIGMYGHIPDIQAEKAGVWRITEVETDDTMQRDKKQRETFRRSAAQRKRTSFEIEVV